MDKLERKYEISFLGKSEAVKDDILEILRKNEMSVVNEGSVSKIKSSYPIKKETFGYLGYVFFSSLPAKIAALNQELRLKNSVLRFIVVSSDSNLDSIKTLAQNRSFLWQSKRKPEDKIESVLKQESPITASKPSKAEKPSPPTTYQGELSNEALEKKLEEILK